VTPPIFPSITDIRGERYPGCSTSAACEGSLCCPSYEAFWSSTPFRVSTGYGGAVAAAGSNRVTIRDSVFRANEAPRGATLRFSSTLSARITNTSIDEPVGEWSSAVSAFGANVATCFGNPCGTGSRCTFRDHSTLCDPCGPNEIGLDGVSCLACSPGSQPNDEQTECVQCESGRASSIGICTFCAAGKTSSADRTGCIPCQPGTYRGAEDNECDQCPVGTQSADGVSCEPCPAGTSPTEARDGCTACDAGKHSTDGIDCTPCDAGSQPSALLTGCDSCTLSGPNSYSPDGAACRDCPTRNTPNYERTECSCQVDTYNALEIGTVSCHGAFFYADGIASDECTVCPPCLDCSVSGGTTLKSGWSFFGASGDAYQCPGRDEFEACPPALLNETASSSCAVGYTGPVCGNCELGFTHIKVSKACSPCDDGVVDVPSILALFCFGLVVAGVALSSIMSIIQEHSFVTDARILVGFFQILSQSPHVLNLTLPYPAPQVIDIVKLLFLNLGKIVKLE
jgi:hypothetical protein